MLPHKVITQNGYKKASAHLDSKVFLQWITYQFQKGKPQKLQVITAHSNTLMHAYHISHSAAAI